MSRNTIIFILATIIQLGNSNCPVDSIPFSNRLLCLSVITNPLLNYSEAINYTISISAELTVLSTIADRSILKMYAAERNVSVVWIGNHSNSSDVGCPALVNDNITSISCSYKLPFAVTYSYEISLPVEGITLSRRYIISNQSVQLNISDSIRDNAPSSTTYKWILNDTYIITTMTVPLVILTPENNLDIMAFDPIIHSGTYQLIASNPLNGAVVYMTELIQAVLTEFIISPVNLTISKGQLAAFQCQATGLPTPNITWYYSIDNQLKELQDSRTFVSPLNTLYIREAVVNDSGTYVCVASNIVGEISTNTTLTVVDGAISSEPGIKLIQSPRNQTVLFNDDSIIECTATLTQPETVNLFSSTNILFFFIEELPKTTTSRSQTYIYYPSFKVFPSIAFPTLQKDYEQFQCRIQQAVPPNNNVTSVYSDIATITINTKSNIESLSVNITMTIIPLGTNIAILCTFTGQPTPYISWFFNGQAINSTTMPASGMSHVIIDGFHSNNTGTYQCVASNVHNTVTRRLTLTATDGELRPVSYTIISISSTTISLKWDVPDISNLIYPSFLQYEIFYNIAESTNDPLTTGRLSDTNFTLNSLISGTRYKINIVAHSIYTTSPDNVQFIETLNKSVSIVPSVTDRPVLSTTSSTSTVMMSSTTITFLPSIAPIIPSNPVPMSTIVLSVVLCIVVIGTTIIIVGVVVHRCWWIKKGSLGNYSPSKIEEDHRRQEMLNVRPKPITPPPIGYSDTDLASDVSVEDIRIDRYISTDTVRYDSSYDLLSN